MEDQANRCELVYLMSRQQGISWQFIGSSPVLSNRIQCELLHGHEDDCLVSWEGKKWRVSQKGFNDHPPREVTA